MVQQYWLAQRSLCLQTNVMAEDLSEGGIKAMNTLSRYHSQHQRHFQQALAQLQKLRTEKRKAEIGFVSQKAIEAGETRRAAAVFGHGDGLMLGFEGLLEGIEALRDFPIE